MAILTGVNSTVILEVYTDSSGTPAFRYILILYVNKSFEFNFHSQDIKFFFLNLCSGRARELCGEISK